MTLLTGLVLFLPSIKPTKYPELCLPRPDYSDLHPHLSHFSDHVGPAEWLADNSDYVLGMQTSAKRAWMLQDCSTQMSRQAADLSTA